MLEGGDQFQNEFLFVIFIVRAMVETAFNKGPFKTFTTASHHEILMEYQQCSLSIYALHKNDSEICEIWVSIAWKQVAFTRKVAYSSKGDLRRSYESYLFNGKSNDCT